MYLPPGYTVAACEDRTHHGGGVLLLCKDYLLVEVIDCTGFYVADSFELITVCFNNIVLLCMMDFRVSCCGGFNFGLSGFCIPNCGVW